MISPSFDIEEFLQAIVGKGFVEIINIADQECDITEQQSHRRKGATNAREMGSMHYAASLKSFLFFMRFGRKPFGVSDREFAMYRPICEALVQKGDFLPTVLDMFK